MNTLESSEQEEGEESQEGSDVENTVYVLEEVLDSEEGSSDSEQDGVEQISGMLQEGEDEIHFQVVQQENGQLIEQGDLDKDVAVRPCVSGLQLLV